MKRDQYFILILFGAMAIASPCIYGMDKAEFQNALQHLNRSQKATDRKLIQLGAKVDPSTLGLNSLPDGNSSDEKKRPPLFIVHDDFKALRAEAGKYLYGKIYNRLIVGGDVSPASVVLAENQGMFSGLRVLGKAKQGGTENRVAVDFDRLVTRQGKVIAIKGLGEDESGAYGFEAEVFSSKAWAVIGALGASFVSGVASSQQSQLSTPFGFRQTEPTGRNSMLQGTAQAAAEQSKKLIDDATRERPVLVVEGDTSVIVYLDEEVRF
jgi:hypothetical protein